jgi:hypothetical protein
MTLCVCLQAAGCAPTAAAQALLASKGGGVRVGPFAAGGASPELRNAGLAAAAEWLHSGAASVVLDLGGDGAGRFECVTLGKFSSVLIRVVFQNTFGWAECIITHSS